MKQVHPRFDYQQAYDAIFATGTVRDGLGRPQHVGFAWDPATHDVLVVAKCGYFRAPLPKMPNVAEAEWHVRCLGQCRDWQRTVDREIERYLGPVQGGAR